MALKATEDPILIRERRETITRLMQRAFSGTVKVGLTYFLHFSHSDGLWRVEELTCAKKSEKGRPLSRAKE